MRCGDGLHVARKEMEAPRWMQFASLVANPTPPSGQLFVLLSCSTCNDLQRLATTCIDLRAATTFLCWPQFWPIRLTFCAHQAGRWQALLLFEVHGTRATWHVARDTRLERTLMIISFSVLQCSTRHTIPCKRNCCLRRAAFSVLLSFYLLVFLPFYLSAYLPVFLPACSTAFQSVFPCRKYRVSKCRADTSLAFLYLFCCNF